MGARPSYLGLDLTRPILRPTERTPRTTFSCMRLKHMAEKVGRRDVFYLGNTSRKLFFLKVNKQGYLHTYLRYASLHSCPSKKYVNNFFCC